MIAASTKNTASPDRRLAADDIAQLRAMAKAMSRRLPAMREDLFQEGVLAFLTAKDGHRFHAARLRMIDYYRFWFYGYRVCDNGIYKCRTRAMLPLPAWDNALAIPDHAYEDALMRCNVRTILRPVSETTRQVMLAYFGFGFTVPELAAKLGVTSGAISRLIARGLAVVRRKWPASIVGPAWFRRRNHTVAAGAALLVLLLGAGKAKATTIEFGAPTLLAAADTLCEAGTVGLTRLDSAVVHWSVVGERFERSLKVINVLPGGRSSVAIAESRPFVAWVNWWLSGKQSCDGMRLLVNAANTAVEESPSLRRAWRVYDIRGRLVFKREARTLAEMVQTIHQLPPGIWFLQSPASRPALSLKIITLR